LFDKDGLEQVFQNIIGNAIKYTPEKGNISVRCEALGDKVIITIKDNGIGISKEHYERIFERFYRVDKARSRDLGGTGLGLAIAKHIAEAHGAEIEVESEVDKGTEFRVIIPIVYRGDENA
jgi:two-component system sensor histidine kinase VicK